MFDIPLIFSNCGAKRFSIVLYSMINKVLINSTYLSIKDFIL